MRAAFTSSVRVLTLRALNYTPAVEHLRLRSAVKFSDLMRLTGNNYGKVFTRFDCEEAFGEQLLSQADVLASEPRGRWIRTDVLRDTESHRLSRWQVLIAGAGQMGPTDLFGRAMLVDERLSGKLIGPDVYRFTFVEGPNDASLFAYAFVTSPTGLRGLRACAYGSSIPRIRTDLMDALPIPLPDAVTQRRVADLIRATVAGRERYLTEVTAARACLEALPEMQQATEMSRDRRAQCVAWSGDLPTLTAWTFASAGEALALLTKKWAGRLGDIVPRNGIYRGGRELRTRCAPPHGVDFHSQRDAFIIRPIPQRIAMSEAAQQASRCKEGTLLVGGQGTLGEGELFGRVSYVAADTADACYSEHLLRILAEHTSREAIFAYLSTLVGFRLMRSCAVGTKLLSLRPDLLRALPIPDLSADLHARVTAHVRSAMEARAAAAAAEREAIRIVEEEVLPQWLA